MIEIPLTQGKVALIDDDDFDVVKGYKWFAVKNRNTWYAQTNVPHDGKYRQRTLQMHALIMEKRLGFKVDHINGDGLDNRRENLRHATNMQNCRNRRHKPKPVTSSPFAGVYPSGKKWKAGIGINGKAVYLGSFPTEEEAAMAYDIAAIKHCGEFASLNFPQKRR